MGNNSDGQEVLETPEIELDLDIEDSGEETDESSVDIEALKAKAKKADELEEKNKQLFARLKKQEPKEETKQEGLSQKDVIYLAKADIHEDDIDEVLEIAKARNWDVKKAHEYIKPILKDREEERKTALATQTKSGPKAQTRDNPDALIDRANKGEEIDPDKLAQARINKLVNRK